MKIRCIVINKQVSDDMASLQLAIDEKQPYSSKEDAFMDGYTPGGEIRLLGLDARKLEGYVADRYVEIELTPGGMVSPPDDAA